MNTITTRYMNTITTRCQIHYKRVVEQDNNMFRTQLAYISSSLNVEKMTLVL